ncbi:E3 ubiquitin-protein ligase RNF19A-like [Branchiostoma floridae]|uniref:RBR-type E3 ubiquitin transferase n=1 Tax=Branchiostoma floridae TaxID=7739 RepID=A0A9J7KEJ8_BRAFL|nr:E3 ubiquitin-protein ligase RNF19A-like [Branchiostoma floridae]
MSFPETDSNSCSSASLSLPGTVRPTRKQSRFSFRHIFSRTRGSKSRRHNKGRDLEGVTMAISSVSAQTSLGSTTGIQLTSGAGGDKATECPLCCTEYPPANFPDIATCPHRSCIDCLRQYLRIEITESRVNISCPECSERFHPTDMQRILGDRGLMDKYEEFMLRRCLVLDPDSRWCPAPDCGYAVIASGCASCPKLQCLREGCGTYFCYHCKAEWHPNQTCDMARQQRTNQLRSSSVSYSQVSAADDIKPCPRCGAYIVKMDDGSCNHMTCAVCGAEFCWLCMKEISDLHYLSPSGCTFWGKKPWSRKKKILWQLGTLVGAPVGIALIASISLPAMIIGIPVYMGRKIHNKYENLPPHRRHLAVTGGVSLSILVAPVLAALTVGIGVPIMLAYVYGVVPISLCRSGGCGVRTTQKGGVRFEFDDDNEATVGAAGTMAGENMSIGPGKEGNPSIGEGSLLSASSSQVERLGVLRDSVSDRDSASTMAIAGSLAGSTGATTAHRLEVQADVQRKRCSVSSESPSASLGDNASTVAMAGSLLNGIGASSYTLGGAVAGATILPLEGTPDLGGAVTGVTVDLAEKQKSRHSSGGSSLDNLQPAGQDNLAASCRATKGSKRGSHRRSKVRVHEDKGRGQEDKGRGQDDKVRIQEVKIQEDKDGERRVWSREESDRRVWTRDSSDPSARAWGRDSSDTGGRAWGRDSCGSSCPSPSISLCSTTDSHCSRTDSHYSEGSLAMSAHTDTSSRGSAAAMSAHTDTSSRGSAAHTDTSSRGSAAAMSAHTDTSSRGSAAHTDTSSRGSAAAMSAHTDTRGSAAHTRASAKLDSSSHSISSATSAKTDTSSCTTAAGMSDKMDASSQSSDADTMSAKTSGSGVPSHGDQSTRGSGVACSRSISPLTEVENDRPDVLSPAPARIVSFPSETQSLGHIVEEREVGGGEGGCGEGGSRRCHSMEEPSPVHMARHQHSSL